MNKVKVTNTLVVDNFSGSLTRYVNGDINSGFAKYNTSFGYDPFTKPKSLTWMEKPVALVNPDGVGIGTLCMAAKTRLDPSTSVLSTYGVFDSGRVAKIQAINTATKNPNYDYATSIAYLTSGSPTFSYGTSLQFYGASVISASASVERVFIGHDKGVTKIDLTGANETLVTNASSVMAGVPRPSANFLGKTYWGNGNNLIEIDSTETVTNYNKLTPGFPNGTFVRDLDVTPDGNYLLITLSRINSPTLTNIDVDTVSLSSADSYKVLWNGIDNSYTSLESYPGYSLTANQSFANNNYTTGYDLNGTALYENGSKRLSLPNFNSPNFGAVFSIGNMIGFVAPEYDAEETSLKASLMLYGQFDEQQPKSLYRLNKYSSIAGSDVTHVPICLPISNQFFYSRQIGWTNQQVGVSKVYYSTIEAQAGGTNVSYQMYRFNLAPTGSGSILTGIYETQTQLFSKKVLVSEVRVYGEPWVADNAFKVDLIGSNNSSIAGASYTFSVPNSSTLTVGQDYAWYNPNHAPTYAIGLRITNIGSTNYTIHKVEIDYSVGGK